MIWKTISQNPYYEVSDTGLVRSNIPGRKQKLVAKRRGSVKAGCHRYWRIGLCAGGKRKDFFLHRIVATAFHPNPLNLPQVNHKDGNCENNCAENLEWVTALQNIEHAVRTGLIKKGQRSHMAKISDERVSEIRDFMKNNAHVSMAEVARLFGVSKGSVALYYRGYRSSSDRVLQGLYGLPPNETLAVPPVPLATGPVTGST